MRSLFWLGDDAWSVIEPLLPRNQPGARRVDDRRVISGIIHVLQSGCRWRDCPGEYGPYTTVYNRFNRWSRRKDLAADLSDPGRAGPDRRHRGARQHLCEGAPLGRRRPKKAPQDQAIGVSRGGRSTKIHLIADLLGRPIVLQLTPGHHADIRVAPELVAKAGPFRRLIADRAYDADRFRASLREAGADAGHPRPSNRAVPIRHDRRRYRERWRIEATIGRLKDFRRVATRYDKLARTFLDAVTLAAIYAFWL